MVEGNPVVGCCVLAKQPPAEKRGCSRRKHPTEIKSDAGRADGARLTPCMKRRMVQPPFSSMHTIWLIPKGREMSREGRHRMPTQSVVSSNVLYLVLTHPSFPLAPSNRAYSASRFKSVTCKCQVEKMYRKRRPPRAGGTGTHHRGSDGDDKYAPQLYHEIGSPCNLPLRTAPTDTFTDVLGAKADPRLPRAIPVHHLFQFCSGGGRQARKQCASPFLPRERS